MNVISPSSLHELLSGDPLALVIDVRTREEHARASIEGTRVLPLSEIRPDGVTALAGDSERPVYILCTSGSRARLAMDRLEIGGFHRGIVVEGGLVAWQKAGLPVVKGTPPGIGPERRMRVAAGAVILLGSLLALTAGPAFIGLSGVAGLGLVVAGISGGGMARSASSAIHPSLG